mmetsp:Transcript_48239/g.120768  ORF Transcript_48239/g.120768 Transcript_48239/m.120768 type:complete len:223 (+) Transcript_48239:115-783(+)
MSFHRRQGGQRGGGGPAHAVSPFVGVGVCLDWYLSAKHLYVCRCVHGSIAWDRIFLRLGWLQKEARGEGKVGAIPAFAHGIFWRHWTPCSRIGFGRPRRVAGSDCSLCVSVLDNKESFVCIGVVAGAEGLPLSPPPSPSPSPSPLSDQVDSACVCSVRNGTMGCLLLCAYTYGCCSQCADVGICGDCLCIRDRLPTGAVHQMPRCACKWSCPLSQCLTCARV